GVPCRRRAVLAGVDRGVVSAERRMRRRIGPVVLPRLRCSLLGHLRSSPSARCPQRGHADTMRFPSRTTVRSWSADDGAGAELVRSTGNRAEVPPLRVFTRQGLRRLGVSERRLRSGEFVRVFLWCYTPRDAPADLRAIAGIARRRVVPGAVICHVTAAELLGLPLPRRLTRAGGAPVHVRVGPEAKRRSAEGLVVHVRSGGR